MALRANIGYSKNNDPYRAGRESALEAIKTWQEDSINLAFIFGSASFDQNRLIAGIKEIIPEIPIFGCSATGIITPQGAVEKGVSVAILNTDTATMKYSWGIGKNVSNNSRIAGYKCGRSAIDNYSKLSDRGKISITRKNFIIFPDGVTGNGADILRGCQEILGNNFPVLGASASDAYMFKKTYQYFPQGIATGAVVGILIGGNLEVGIGIKHGWRPLGKYRKVTSSRANIIQQIDNKPAVSIYEEYFGEETRILKEEPMSMMGMLYPIGMVIPEEEKYLLRSPFKTGKDGELICSAEVPAGNQIRLMIGNRNGVLMAAREAAVEALKNLGQKTPGFALVFSSISRKKLLGRNCSKEIDVIKNILGKDIPIIGFYSYGELAPLLSKMYTGQSYFHNESIVVAVIGD